MIRWYTDAKLLQGIIRLLDSLHHLLPFTFTFTDNLFHFRFCTVFNTIIKAKIRLLIHLLLHLLGHCFLHFLFLHRLTATRAKNRKDFIQFPVLHRMYLAHHLFQFVFAFRFTALQVDVFLNLNFPSRLYLLRVLIQVLLDSIKLILSL